MKSGPGLEIFKFAIYVFLPVGTMVYFGAPSFYQNYVEKDLEKFNPPPTNFPATTLEGARKQLEELRSQRRAREQEASKQDK